jgi:hypothetical protein
MNEKATGVPEETEDLGLPEDVRQRLLSLMTRMLEAGIFAVYGDEDDGVPDAEVDCAAVIRQCRAQCCTLSFALTREEAQKGAIRHDSKRPFFIARDPDGWCVHLDRGTFMCGEYGNRPLRCRRYDCRRDHQAPSQEKV